MSERATFTLLVLLHLVPVWGAEYPASCDGPAHLETAYALRQRALGEPSIHREYLAVRRDPTASWFPAVSLAVLMTAVPPVAALKVFTSGYVLLFPLAVRYAVRGLVAGPPVLAYAAFPLVYNRLLLYGFFGFLYGLTVFLYLLGWWLRRPPGTHHAWRLTALALGLQAAHVFALLAALLTVGLLGLAEVAAASGHRARVLADRVLMPLHAFVPALVLAAVFVVPRFGVRTGEAAGAEAPPGAFLRNVALASYGEDAAERALALSFLAWLALVVGWQASRALLAPAAHDALLLVVGIWTVAWMAAPAALARGSFLKERAALCGLVTLVLWVASRPPVRPLRAAAPFAVIALALLGLHAVRFGEVSRQVRTYAACAAEIAPGATLLPIGAADPRGGVPFLEHAASYVAIRRAGINLGNYQPATDHFPLALRARRRPPAVDERALPDALAALRSPARSFMAAAVEGAPEAPEYLLVSGEARALLAAVAPYYRLDSPCPPDRVAVLRRRAG